MTKRFLSIVAVGFGISFLLATIAATQARAQAETVLHSFAGTDGDEPYGGLLMDKAGNLYGTTNSGGTVGVGTVFELVNSPGGYTESVLYNFVGPASSGDGVSPQAGLVMDLACDLFGTTYSGGSAGYGTVFELANSGSCSSPSYSETLLWSFQGGSDGQWPTAGVVMDSNGNLYGTTSRGGSGYGTVFELAKSALGGYSETVLYSFGNGSGGGIPYAPVILDGACDLFGTTLGGGASSDGTVYELVNSSGSCTSPGTYSETVLHSFAGTLAGDGNLAYAGLVADTSGNLYGTTSQGGAHNVGVVYELAHTSYTEKILYSFTGNTLDGDASTPLAPLLMDSSGDLFGTTEYGGTVGVQGNGAVFELVNSPTTPGTYTEKVLLGFTGVNGDGALPLYGGLIADGFGTLYGTTSSGGTSNDGTAYELAAAPAPAVTLNPTSLSFNNVLLNTQSAAQTVTVTNAGNADLTFGSGAVTLTGTNNADFEITSDGCSSLTIGFTAPGNTCSVSVTFTPSTTSATESASLSFADNAPGSPQAVSLTGTGVQAVVTLSPPSLTFNSQPAGTTSPVQTVTLTNTGSTSLTINSIVPSPSEFAVATPPTGTPCSTSTPVPGSGSCTIGVTFTPASGDTGTIGGTLSISDVGAGSPQTVDLIGTVAASPLSDVEAIEAQLVGLYPEFQQSSSDNSNGLFNDLKTYLVNAGNDLSASPPNTCDAIHQLEGFVTKATPYEANIPGLGQLVTEVQGVIVQLEATPGLKCKF